MSKYIPRQGGEGDSFIPVTGSEVQYIEPRAPLEQFYAEKDVQPRLERADHANGASDGMWDSMQGLRAAFAEELDKRAADDRGPEVKDEELAELGDTGIIMSQKRTPIGDTYEFIVTKIRLPAGALGDALKALNERRSPRPAFRADRMGLPQEAKLAEDEEEQ